MVTRSVEERMRSFVAWLGWIPPDAVQLDDAAARTHAATWIRRTIGKGTASNYVCGYEAGQRWWTFFFERESSPALGLEAWAIEAYSHDGTSWARPFLYLADENRWFGAAPSGDKDAPATSEAMPASS